MITFMVEHVIKDGHEEEAKKIFQMVTDSVMGQPGLVFRQVLRSQKNPRKVTTVVCWESMKALEDYRSKRPPRTQAVIDEEMKHFDVMTSEMYDVADKVKL